MAYQINFTDSVNKGSIQVDDNTVNTETSLSLPGRNKSDYGQIVLENLLHILENFANNNPPRNPVEGQLWYDTTVGVDQLKVYDGAQWVSASNIKKANTQPEASESNLGDLWVDVVNQQLFLYNGNGWTLVGPEISSGNDTGARFASEIDTTNQTKNLIKNNVNGQTIAIVSDSEFQLKSAIPGFTRIYSGINLHSDFKYWGTAEKAENLVVPGEGTVLASNFARRDKDNTFTRPIRIQNNTGLNIGETPTLSMSVSGSNSFISNASSGGDIRFRLSQGNFTNTVLTIKSNGLVGFNNVNPLEAVDVVGNIKTSGKVIISNTSNESVALSVIGNIQSTANLIVKDITAETITARDIAPDETNTRNLGTPQARYNNVYSQRFVGSEFTGGQFTGTFIGALQGSATSLTSSTLFNVTGEVSIPSPISYNGTQQTITFNTTIDPAFISNKPLSNTINQISGGQTVFDEILINRPGVGLRKVNQNVLLSTIPVIPIGTIMPYGGDVAPTGWLLCDGSAINKSIYSSLFAVIGYKFDPTLTNQTNFRLPDFRGRFALGNRAMTNVNQFGSPLDPNQPAPDSSTVSDLNASVVGQTEGSATKNIEVENLPDHEHSLVGDQGTKFYASSNIPLAPDSEVDGLAQPIAGAGAGSFMPQTTGILGGVTNQPFDVVNPYQTVNYIIFFGVTA
jgi:microcystin-dependent protein